MGSLCFLLFLKIGENNKEEELVGKESQGDKTPAFTGAAAVWGCSSSPEVLSGCGAVSWEAWIKKP